VPKRFTPFEPQPAPAALPDALPDPFHEGPPHPLAARAAAALQRELVEASDPREGKMWGVLVALAPDGTVGWLRAFSGQLGGEWHAPGCAPPLFGPEARAQVEVPGERHVAGLVAAREALTKSPTWGEIRDALAGHDARAAASQAEMRERHQSNRAARHAARAQATDPAALAALDAASRADKAERRHRDAALAAERAPLAAAAAELDAALGALDEARRVDCADLMRRIHDTYLVQNALGEATPLRALYAPAEPPSGAGDCAAPKLLAAALVLGWRPVALTEFWWGPPPPSGLRLHGVHAPACRGKCGPLLPFLLRGVPVAWDAPRPAAPPDDAGGLRVVHEDPWLVVVDKPSGLLSVPGRGAHLQDSVLTRLRARFPHATGPLLVHRLDQDTSGLLLAALDAETHVALQRLFLEHTITKTYVAWVDGEVSVDAGEAGEIALPLRGDPDDRPRQLVDPLHGAAALTEWRVEARRGERTRLSLRPRTGRTHQLRVHLAHPAGLGAPIVGDRLYGRGGPERLMLHAAELRFTHPRTGEAVCVRSEAPF
jgi:tRNA pseudouridine32 synthase/23S rRNA pseudouridine746 synthase